ncbi:MAG TPA: glycosyltransferase 87 family protein [Nocardioidaceae bacterium]|nr:glycosyltransferase 87 family protein [Nocardioidaceae bacterium]
MSQPARPSLDDPLVTTASEAIGGPVGEHAAPHPWWTPVRVILAVTALVFALGMVQKTPCVTTNWSDSQLRYAAMCYSDVPYLYVGRGFAELNPPFSDTGGRYQVMEYPVFIGYFAYGAAVLTQAAVGDADLDERRSMPVDQVHMAPGVGDEVGLYFVVTAVLLAAVLLVAAWFMAGAQRGRPWDAMLFAASPALLLTGLINWDILAVAMVAGAFWAWARGHLVLTGVMIGLGTATKLYPLFLLGALLVVCLRNRRLREFAVVTLAAALAWLVTNAPVLWLGFEQWKVFWTFNSDRGADLGSLWLVWSQAGNDLTPETVNLGSWIFFALVCVSVLALGMLAPRTPRVAQLAFLIVAGFLLVNKVYSPQYVLWLLPLAVLARPRWRDLLIWQAGEIFYFAAVWFYLGEFTASSVSGEPDKLYWLAIFVRVAAELYLVVMIVRDILQPWRDPVPQEQAAIS